MYKKYLKRLFDCIFAILLFILVLPIVVLTAIVVRITMGSPVLFVQERIGYKNYTFKVYKFRTMKNTVGKDGQLLSDEERITKSGNIIRKLSLDELPQLFNIIKGEMSFIGPRPLLIEYLPLYNDFQIQRHNVLPGISGWAQVNGRNQTTWDDRFKYDVEYVNNISVILDFKIVIKTIQNIVLKKGVNQEAGIGMSRFEGRGSID